MYQNNPLALYNETDQKAHQAATSPHNDLPEPTPEQKESGDYAKGHVTIAGLPIAIENPQYSTRTGVDADGQEWSVTMRTHYGYLEGTLGADGDEVDVILMPRTEPDFAGDVYVIKQIDPSTGEFDEHKVVIGAFDEDQAIEAYHANYDADWQGFGGIKSLDMAAFKEWLSLPPDGMMFDSLGQGIGAITEQDVQDDPLGVLDTCLKQLTDKNTSPTDIDPNYDIMATANPTSKAGMLSLAIEQQRQNRKYFTDANKQALQKRTTITDDSITSQQAAKASVDKLQAMYADEIATINQKYGESTIEIGTAQDVERSNEDEEKHVLIVGTNWFGRPSVLSPDEDQAIIDRLIDWYAYYEHSPVDFDDDDDELRKFSKHLNKVSEFLAVHSEKDVDDVMQMAMLWFGFRTNTFERSLNGTLFDSMGTGLDTFTHDDIERDPLGVLAACLMTLQQPTAIDPNNHKQTLRYVNQAVDQLASASLAQRSISFDYFIEMKNLMVAAGYPISDILDIEQKLMTSAIIGGDARRSEAKGLLYSEYAKNAQDVFTIASDIQDDVLLYDQRIKTASQARNAEIHAAWSTHVEYQNSVVNAYNNLSQETPEDIEKAAALLAEYHELRKTTWEKIKAPYEDAFRSEKDQIAATLVTHGQAIIDRLIYTATIDEPTANDWASQQIITGAAVKHLKKIKYPEVQVRKDLAQLYRVTNGRISHVMLDHISGTRRAYTVETQSRTSSKAIYLDGDFDKRTLFHEMGHHMESDKAALAAAQGFLKGKRGSDDKLYRLKNLVPNSKYDAQELAYKGDFFNPYVGKHYQDGTTEVWSMGLESFADPVVLSQRIEYDTAMFAMIVGGIRAEKHPFAEVSTALAGQKVSSRIEDLKKIEFIRNRLTEKIAQKIKLSKVDNIHPDLLEILMYARPDAVYIGSYKSIHLFSAKVRNVKTKRKCSGYVVTWQNVYSSTTYRVEAADPDFDMIKVYVGLIKTMAGSFSASAFLSMQKRGIPLEELNNAWQILKDE